MAVATLVLLGCGSTDVVSPSPPVLTTACVGLDAARCDRAVDAMAEHPFVGRTAIHVAVAERFCDGPCPGADHGAWLGHLTISFSDGLPSATVLIEVDGDEFTWEQIETALIRVEPSSPRLAAQVVRTTLGHCGLASGIDVDGTFWDPVGAIDLDQPALINSAAATFELQSPNVAVLRTDGGAVVLLARRPGPAYLVGCD